MDSPSSVFFIHYKNEDDYELNICTLHFKMRGTVIWTPIHYVQVNLDMMYKIKIKISWTYKSREFENIIFIYGPTEEAINELIKNFRKVIFPFGNITLEKAN